MEANRKRSERAAARWARERARQDKELARQEARDEAAREVAEYQAWVEMLTSLHREGGETWDWRALAKAPAPPEPERRGAREEAARAALAAYRPGWLDRTFGGATRRQAELEQNVALAAAEDEREFEAARTVHAEAVAGWRARKRLAAGIVAGDPASYRRAVEELDPFDAITALGTTVRVSAATPELVGLSCVIGDSDLVPREELSLTARGAVSTKKLPEGRYQALYQEHVCSCAFRVAREALALLPVGRVLVHVIEPGRIDRSTGHPVPVTVLSASFLRSTLAPLRFETLVAADALRHVHHRMRFKKSSGFEPVEPIDPDEQWVTT